MGSTAKNFHGPQYNGSLLPVFWHFEDIGEVDLWITRVVSRKTIHWTARNILVVVPIGVGFGKP
jgi:hypothetical protein